MNSREQLITELQECMKNYSWSAAAGSSSSIPHKLLLEIIATLASKQFEDAAKWRALMSCGRIRNLGSAGLNDPKAESAHVGFEFWTSYSVPEDLKDDLQVENIYGRKILEDFVDKAIELQK